METIRNRFIFPLLVLSSVRVVSSVTLMKGWRGSSSWVVVTGDSCGGFRDIFRKVFS